MAKKSKTSKTKNNSSQIASININKIYKKW